MHSGLLAAPRAGVGRRRAGLAAPVAALAVLLAGALPAKPLAEETAAAGVMEVHIDNFAFTPAEVTVDRGTTVKWTNRDDIPHTVAEKGLSFRSRPMDTDESFSHTFTTPGVVDYFCTLHPHMTGRVIVK